MNWAKGFLTFKHAFTDCFKWKHQWLPMGTLLACLTFFWQVCRLGAFWLSPYSRGGFLSFSFLLGLVPLLAFGALLMKRKMENKLSLEKLFSHEWSQIKQQMGETILVSLVPLVCLLAILMALGIVLLLFQLPFLGALLRVIGGIVPFMMLLAIFLLLIVTPPFLIFFVFPFLLTSEHLVGRERIREWIHFFFSHKIRLIGTAVLGFIPLVAVLTLLFWIHQLFLTIVWMGHPEGEILLAECFLWVPLAFLIAPFVLFPFYFSVETYFHFKRQANKESL